MNVVVNTLVFAHKPSYVNIEVTAKEITEKLVTHHFNTLISVTGLMTPNAAAEYSQRVIDLSVKLLDRVLIIVIDALSQDKECILVNIQRVLLEFKLSKRNISG